jgi:hypothetical protein
MAEPSSICRESDRAQDTFPFRAKFSGNWNKPIVALHGSTNMTMALPNPFMSITPEVSKSSTSFRLNEEAFLVAIDPAPKFLSDPSHEYMTAIELMPIVEILAAYR